MIPSMIRSGYTSSYAAAAASSGGTIGILLPPSNPMIIFAILANVSVTAMFTVGIMPGLLVAVCMTAMAMIKAKMEGVTVDQEQPPFGLKVFVRSLGKGCCALCMPFIILGSIYTGMATPVVAVVWALFVGFVVNKALPNSGRAFFVSCSLRRPTRVTGAGRS